MIKDKALKLVNELIAENKALKAALAQPAKELDHGDELTIAYMSGVHRGKELAAQSAQKPVAWMDIDGNFSDNNDHKCFPIPLYTITHPPRPWAGLTDEEIDDLHNKIKVRLMGTFDTKDIYRAIEAKLKEKNT